MASLPLWLWHVNFLNRPILYNPIIGKHIASVFAKVMAKLCGYHKSIIWLCKLFLASIDLCQQFEVWCECWTQSNYKTRIAKKKKCSIRCNMNHLSRILVTIRLRTVEDFIKQFASNNLNGRNCRVKDKSLNNPLETKVGLWLAIEDALIYKTHSYFKFNWNLCI